MALTKVSYSMISGAFINVQDYGAVGNNTNDDTAAIQAAFTYAGTNNKIVYFPTGKYKTTSALTFSGEGGIFMESCGYGGAGATDSGIFPTGSGYVALTIGGILSTLKITLGGGGNQIHGLFLNNPIISNFEYIRVYNFDGFGIRVHKSWDCVFNAISVESCGSTFSSTVGGYTYPSYAFGMFDAGDTCNMSHIVHLQVEQASGQAIYISPNTLSCVFDNIHSERALGVGGSTTWSLGGNRCTYNTLRLSTNNPANASVLFDLSNSTVISSLIEGNGTNPPIQYQAYGGSNVTFIACEWQSTAGLVSGNVGTVNFIGGSFAKISTNSLAQHFYGSTITSLTLGFSSGNPLFCTFNNCTIATLASSSAVSSATFTDCLIAECNSFLESNTVLNNTVATSASTINVSYRTLNLNNSTVNGNVSIDNGSINSKGSRIAGTLTQSAGSISSLFDGSSYATGAVSGLGVVTGGTWSRGQRTFNLAPVGGSPKSWVCTVAGTPGTWVSEGNL